MLKVTKAAFSGGGVIQSLTKVACKMCWFSAPIAQMSLPVQTPLSMQDTFSNGPIPCNSFQFHSGTGLNYSTETEHGLRTPLPAQPQLKDAG